MEWFQIEKHRRSLKALAVAVVAFPMMALAQTPAAPASQPSPAPTPRPKELLMPSLSLRVRDGQLLAQLMQKNKWFGEFRQTGFYQGAVLRIAPVLFAPPDDHGSAAKAWNGRLLDYLYEKVLTKRPVTLHYYRKPNLTSPFVVSVSGLTKTEQSLVTGLMKALANGNPRPIEAVHQQNIDVAPIQVKGQRFAAVLRDGCLSLGRSADATAAASVLCPRLAKFNSDAELRVGLDEMFPALSSVRERFLGLMPEMRVQMAWKANESRFTPSSSEADLLSGQHLLLKEKMPDELLQALPSASLFFTTGFVPTPKNGFAPPQLAAYLKEPKADLRKARPMPVALAYLVADPSEKFKTTGYPAVLLHLPGANDETIKQLAETFNRPKRAEVFVRRACPGIVAISNAAEAIDLIQATCGKKRPSFLQMPTAYANALKGKTLAASLFLNPGLFLSSQIGSGWRKIKTEQPAPEIKASRELAEKLPAQLFTGLADEKKLVLKAIE